MISIIIRTKNEEEWLEQCLKAVFAQKFVEFEVIIVDNESTDRTREIISQFPITLVEITQAEFSYGKAINRGIAAAKGELIVCLSGHCIPANQSWLWNLQANFIAPETAGVYGRQEPIASTSVLDKRDLWNTFGHEKKVQTKDPFFHNANSMFRRSVWEEIPFDEKTSGVEDRIWAKKVLARGYNIIYEPLASVYHPHGLNQGANIQRAERVVDVIEKNKLHKKT
jgi:rhamnosyltransferase